MIATLLVAGCYSFHVMTITCRMKMLFVVVLLAIFSAVSGELVATIYNYIAIYKTENFCPI